ncbi:MAG: ABC transporter ATP-binding protein [Planctomycetota bacterium]
MSNFLRALRDSLRYWKSLVVATLCSLGIAALWSGNIAAFYPILQVVLDNQSIQQWMDRQIGEKQAELQETEQRIQALEQAASNQASSAEQPELAREKRQRARIDGELSWYLKYRPTAERFLPNDPFDTVVWIVGLLLVTTLIKNLLMVLNEYLVSRIAIDITREIRGRLFAKALYIDRSTFSGIGTSGFNAYIIQTAEGLSQGLVGTLGGAIREPLKIVACLIGAALINWRLLLASLIFAPLAGGLLYLISGKMKRLANHTLEKSLSFHDVLLESLNNSQTVQAYAMEPAEEKRFADATEVTRRYALKFSFYTALSKPIIEALGVGMLCTAIVCGAYLVLKQQTSIWFIPLASQPLSVEGLLTFFGMLIGMTDPLRKFAAVFSSIHLGSISADAIYKLLEHPTHITNPPEPKILARPHHRILFHDVSFGYQPERTVIEQVDLEIPFGQTVAFVGANGAGKSTITSLLCRFYDPVNGSILLDDVNLRDLSLEDLRSRVAIVAQQTELFNETVRYNIRYGSPNASDADVERSAREAHAWEFIHSVLPEGLDTRVGQNGNRLSGGQRQRIALARALLRNPEILILDECTSQIDLRSEELIRDSLMAHRGQRTMIIITHRESLLALADVVYEVGNGQIHPRFDHPRLAVAS